jgi:ketosteroid isomerase-like protein
VEAADVLDAYAAAWSRGEPEAAWEFHADEVVMHLPGQGSLAGTHRGREAVIAAIRELLARTDGLPVEVEVIDRLTSPDRVAMLLREAASRDEDHLEFRRVNVYRVRDDKIVEIDIFEADHYDVDAFFG